MFSGATGAIQLSWIIYVIAGDTRLSCILSAMYVAVELNYLSITLRYRLLLFPSMLCCSSSSRRRLYGIAMHGCVKFSPPGMACLCYCLSSSLSVPFDVNYLRIYRTDLHQFFRIGRHMGGHDQSDLFAITQGTLLW